MKHIGCGSEYIVTKVAENLIVKQTKEAHTNYDLIEVTPENLTLISIPLLPSRTIVNKYTFSCNQIRQI